jgi:hypothetical protein
VVSEALDETGNPIVLRKTIRTSLPLFVLAGSAATDVVFRERPLEKPERLIRLDRKLEEEPYLPSIRTHLYKR